MSKRDSLSKEVYTVSEIPFVKEREIRISVYNKHTYARKRGEEGSRRGEKRKEREETGYVLSLQKTSINKCRRNDSIRKPSFITASGKDHRWMLKLLGE